MKRVDLNFGVDNSFPNVDLLASCVKHTCSLIEARGRVPGNVALADFFYCLNFFKSIGVPQIDSTINCDCNNLQLARVNVDVDNLSIWVRVGCIDNTQRVGVYQKHAAFNTHGSH